MQNHKVIVKHKKKYNARFRLNLNVFSCQKF
jgi:hypothetical protein